MISYPLGRAREGNEASLLMGFYSIRSERQFCERLQYDLLFKWFLGLFNTLLGDGIQPEQVELGIRQALDRGLTTPRRLRESAAKRSARIRAAIEDAVERGTA